MQEVQGVGERKAAIFEKKDKNKFVSNGELFKH